MGVLSWIVVVGAAAGGVYCYRRLRTIEEEIRLEEKQPTSSDAGGVPPSDARKSVTVDEKNDMPLGAALIIEVGKTPGILQTELYRRFPEENRRALQDEIRNLVRLNKLRRQKEKSTFRIFPGEG